MIELFIDGNKVLFVGNKDIKLTKNNPYITGSGTYSLEVEIPLDVPENLKVFGPLQRIDVTKNVTKFSAMITARSKVIFNGSAKLTSITEDMAKIQLVGGNSDINLITGETDIYVDELPFDEIDLSDIASDNGAESQTTPSMDWYEMLRQFYKRWYCSILSYDSENDLWLNGTTEGEKTSFSPNFLFTLRAIVAALGYHVSRCDYDNTPIHDLYIPSGYGFTGDPDMADILKWTLPHWTLDDFFDEVQNLLNCTIAFNEKDKSVSIINNATTAAGTVELEVEDKFTTEIDEEKVEKTPSTSNLCYSCSDEDDWAERFFIPQSVHDKFEHKSFVSYSDLVTWANNNPDDAKWLIMHAPDATAIYITTDSEVYLIDLYGMRYVGSTEKKELKIGPVQTKSLDWPDGNVWQRYIVKGPNPLIAGVTVRPEHILMAYEEDYSSYSSKEDAKADEMRLVYISGWNPTQQQQANKYVMALRTSSTIYFPTLPKPEVTIGDLFKNSLGMNDKVLYKFNFVADDVPDVGSVFLIRNKKYLCKKIEYTMRDDGIKPEMSGEFYELES